MPDEVQDIPSLHTDRLILRSWLKCDRVPFAALNADPMVMEVFPKRLTRRESDAGVERILSKWQIDPPSFWAATLHDGTFIGMVGLNRPTFAASFTPCVEIGWRLARFAWGRGYATEAAKASLEFGFDALGLDQVISFTVPHNKRSLAVIRRLGMVRDPDGDFDHPNLSPDHPSCRHILFRLDRARWRAQD